MINFTPRARSAVLSYLGDEGTGTDALRVRVRQGAVGGSPGFELALVPLAERSGDERRIEADGFSVLVRESDVAHVDGAQVDFVERVNESAFEVTPATSATRGARANAEGADAVTPGRNRAPSGEIADRVREVLDDRVNPAIAAHGGMISLVDVDGNEIYVEMSGGCQGCALSRMTLRQGVERMLREAVPELTAVHDITDHASGENPYL